MLIVVERRETFHYYYPMGVHPPGDLTVTFNLLIGLDGYTICSGVISETLNGPNIRAVPLLVDDSMQIGYLTHKQVQPGRFGKQYIEILKKYTEQV